jgi:glycosyltransferase involved in cell wall biosynthesis
LECRVPALGRVTDDNVPRQALICAYHVVSDVVDSSSRRLFHFVDFLLEAEWSVTVAAKNLDDFDRRAAPLRRRGVPVHPLLRDDFEQLVTEVHFDVAIVAFWHVAEQVVNTIRRCSPDTRIVVDSMDVHFLRGARSRLGIGGTAALDAQFGVEMAREINVYAAADAALAVSGKEASLIADLVNEEGLTHVVSDCEAVAESPRPFTDRRGALVIGNYEHQPNVDALQYLCSDIVTRIDPALLAEHPIKVIGNELSAERVPFAQGVPGVELVGWVPSVFPYLEEARVSLVPLRYGAGTKRKVLQTMMIGTPAVSTSIGIESIPAEHGRHILVADDPASFADATTTLLTDENKWRRLSQEGRERILEVHGPEASRRQLMGALEDVLSREPKPGPLPAITGVWYELPRGFSDRTSLRRRLERLVAENVPPGAVISVVSGGDPELRRHGGRTCLDFPPEVDDMPAGRPPETSAQALAHLDQTARTGSQFLVLPQESSWWLDHYPELATRLSASVVAASPGVGAIYDLASNPAPVSPESTTTDRSISVVIPTRDRASLLRESLLSLCEQTLPKRDFEVIVIDDGSKDSTRDVCQEFAGELNIRYERLERSGIAVAKNAGVAAASAPIVLFFDDDDVADRNLLAEHLAGHRLHPEETVAVLGHTTWAPWLAVNEVMHFVTDVGHYLFAYDGLEEGQRLDFTYFWGGRASCKLALLTRLGLFRPEFEFGCEDIELAFRLSHHGFSVVYWPHAMQYMNREVTYDGFCHRCERQGVAQAMFGEMHEDPVVQEFCAIDAAIDAESMIAIRSQVSAIEGKLASGSSDAETLRTELWALYWRSFDAAKTEGFRRAVRDVHGALAPAETH